MGAHRVAGRVAHTAALGCRSVEALESRTLMAGDPVLAWNETLLDAVRVDRTPPPLAARNMAMVQLAVYDAVNAIDRGHAGYRSHRRGPRGASIDAAVAAAAHGVLARVFPAQIATFDAKLAEALAEVPDGKPERQGVALGTSCANKIIKARKRDGADKVAPYVVGAEPGDWRPTPPGLVQPPLLAQWPDLKPFGLRRPEQFRPEDLPALTSAEYTQAFNEVKELGSADSAARTAEQTTIARFWADGAGTATPPGHWNDIAQDVAADQGNTLAENARLFALLNIALADAGIAAWDCKYEFDFWRPVTGIRAADADGNPDTAADGSWTPLLPTPPFQAYISGHSTFSAAAAKVLASFYGTDSIAFSTSDEDGPGVTRDFPSFSAAAAEAGQSRVYGGIHWQFDNTDGLETGAAVGEHVVGNLLKPARRRNVSPQPTASRHLEDSPFLDGVPVTFGDPTIYLSTGGEADTDPL